MKKLPLLNIILLIIYILIFIISRFFSLELLKWKKEAINDFCSNNNIDTIYMGSIFGDATLWLKVLLNNYIIFFITQLYFFLINKNKTILFKYFLIFQLIIIVIIALIILYF